MMARKAPIPAQPAVMTLRYCPYCRVERRGLNFAKHLRDAHSKSEHDAAVKLLRQAKLKTTPLS